MVIAQKVGEKSGLIGAAQPGDRVAYAVIIGLSGLPGWKDDRSAAVRLFEQVRERIPPDAYTVFTGLDATGEWKVFVARGDRVMAFDPPPKP